MKISKKKYFQNKKILTQLETILNQDNLTIFFQVPIYLFIPAVMLNCTPGRVTFYDGKFNCAESSERLEAFWGWPSKTAHRLKSRKMHLVVVHNILMIGPPGAGKTLLAHTMPSILPRMTIDEALDVTCIYSVADLCPADVRLTRSRPFRAPRRTSSHARLL